MDDLKAKLATQEVELRQKNEDADKLIQAVGIETDKVSREKALADEEEQKVAFIMLEVEQKQKDCEEDLAKAEPALTAAQTALNTLNKVGLWACLPSGTGAESSSDPQTALYPCVPKRQGQSWEIFEGNPAVTRLFIKQTNIYLNGLYVRLHKLPMKSQRCES